MIFEWVDWKNSTRKLIRLSETYQTDIYDWRGESVYRVERYANLLLLGGLYVSKNLLKSEK